MKRIKYDNIFIFISFLFILCCCLFYGIRLIYFYRIENPKIVKKYILYDNIIQDKNLKNEDKNYYFSGKNPNNFLEYSGRLFRIVSVSEDGYAKIITEDNQTSLVWGYNQNYEDSYIRSWLNNSDNEYKSFIDSLHNKEGFMVNNKSYIDTIDNDNITNKKEISDKAGLISVYEYNLAGAEDSYLNNGNSFWTSNNDENQNTYYVYKTGALIKEKNQIIGVRPTITINAKISNFKGNGTKNNPYKITFDKGDLLKDKYVGEYIKLDDDIYKIIETDNDYVKVVSELTTAKKFGSSSYFSNDYGVGMYLNNSIYQSLPYKEKILLGIFNTGKYDETNYYDFNIPAAYNEKAYISLLSLGELFIEDYENYFLLSRPLVSKNEVYQVKKDGLITLSNINNISNIRYCFHLDSEQIVTSGNGSKKEPYIVR